MGPFDFLKRKGGRGVKVQSEWIAWLADAAGVTAIKSSGVDPIQQASLLAGRDIQPSDAGYGQAFVASVWAYRALSIRAAKAAELLASGVCETNGTADETQTDPLKIAAERTFRAFGQDVYEAWMLSRLIWGKAYIEVARDYPFAEGGPGIAAAFRVLNPEAITRNVRGGEVISYQYRDDERTVTFKPDDIIYDRAYNPTDDLEGLSPLGVALEAVNSDRHTQTIARAFLKNNMRPGLIFTPKADMTEADLDRLIQKLREEHGGPKNAGRPLLMNKAMDVTTVPPPTFEDQTNLSVGQMERISAACGVPLALMNYNNMRFQLSPEQRASFYTETVIPDVTRAARVVNAFMLPVFDAGGRLEYKVDTDAALEKLEDQSVRTTRLTTQFTNGGLTFNEYRQKLGYSPVPGGDWFGMLVNGTIKPIRVSDIARAPEILGQIADAAAAGPGQTPAYPMLPAPRPALPPGNQPDQLAELRAWRKKALNAGAVKAARFECYRLENDIAQFVRDRLSGMLTPAGVRAVFDQAELELKKKRLRHQRNSRAFTTILTPSPMNWVKAGYRTIWSGPAALLVA